MSKTWTVPASNPNPAERMSQVDPYKVIEVLRAENAVLKQQVERLHKEVNEALDEGFNMAADYFKKDAFASCMPPHFVGHVDDLFDEGVIVHAEFNRGDHVFIRKPSNETLKQQVKQGDGRFTGTTEREMNIEICCQCRAPTGKAGRNEDSLYAAADTPAECGPLCPTCYETLRAKLMDAAPVIASEQKPVEEVQWRNIKSVVRQLADWAFGSQDDPKYGSCWLAMVTGLTCKDGPNFKLEAIPKPSTADIEQRVAHAIAKWYAGKGWLIDEDDVAAAIDSGNWREYQ